MIIQKKAMLTVEVQTTVSLRSVNSGKKKKAETGSSKAVVKPQDPKIKQL